MPRKLVLALAITNLFACSHTYKSEASSFINKPLPTQKEVKPSVPATAESAQLPQGTFLKTTTPPATELNKVISSTTKVAEPKIATAKTTTDLIGTSNETIPTNGIKKVAELSITVVPGTKQSDNAVSSLPTIFNDQHSHAKSKICLDTSRLAKNRSTLHPNWDSLKKIEINKAIFKQLFINDPLADEIAALNNIWFNGDKVENFDKFKEKTTEKRDNAPKQTPKTRSRTIKLHRNYKNYHSLVQKIAEQTQVDAALLHAVIQAESSYNPRARSPRGAVGLMQLMPATARRFGAKNLTDPTTNVYAGARYLRYLLKLFNNNKKLALAGYNAGEYAVKRHGNKIPPYRQTRRYVNKVMSLYEAHRNNM